MPLFDPSQYNLNSPVAVADPLRGTPPTIPGNWQDMLQSMKPTTDSFPGGPGSFPAPGPQPLPPVPDFFSGLGNLIGGGMGRAPAPGPVQPRAPRSGNQQGRPGGGQGGVGAPAPFLNPEVIDIGGGAAPLGNQIPSPQDVAMMILGSKVAPGGFSPGAALPPSPFRMGPQTREY